MAKFVVNYHSTNRKLITKPQKYLGAMQEQGYLLQSFPWDKVGEDYITMLRGGLGIGFVYI